MIYFSKFARNTSLTSTMKYDIFISYRREGGMEMADAIYLEPLTAETVKRIIEKEIYFLIDSKISDSVIRISLSGSVPSRENKIRESFDLEGTPIVIFFKNCLCCVFFVLAGTLLGSVVLSLLRLLNRPFLVVDVYDVTFLVLALWLHDPLKHRVRTLSTLRIIPKPAHIHRHCHRLL